MAARCTKMMPLEHPFKCAPLVALELVVTHVLVKSNVNMFRPHSDGRKWDTNRDVFRKSLGFVALVSCHARIVLSIHIKLL